MIKPNQIETKDFRKSAVGYSTEEVDKFIDEIYVDYSTLYKENLELKEKITTMEESIKYYNSIEKTLQNTLLMAQKAADDAKTEAELQAKQICEQAKKEYNTLMEEIELTKYQYEEEMERKKKKFTIDVKSQRDMLANEIKQLTDRYNSLRDTVLLMLYSEIETLKKNTIDSSKKDIYKDYEEEADKKSSESNSLISKGE